MPKATIYPCDILNNSSCISLIEGVERNRVHFLSMTEQVRKIAGSMTLPIQEIIKGLNIGTLSAFQQSQQIIDSSLVSSICKVNKSFADHLAPFHTFQKNIESFTLPVTREVERLAEQLRLPNDLFDKFDNIYVKSLSQIHESALASLSSPSLQRNIELLHEATNRFQSFAAQIDFGSLEIADDGSAVLSGEYVNQEEINQSITHIFEDVSENIIDDNFIVNLLDKLEPLKKPIQSILLYIILPYIMSVLGGLHLSYYQSLPFLGSPQNRQESIRFIKKSPPVFFLEQQLNLHRFVTVDVLNVRISPKRSSERIGEVYFGQTVRVVQKKRNWTFVEYIDEDDAVCTGWVYTRHLKQFKK